MAANVYQSVKNAMQDLIGPQLEAVKGEIGALRGELNGLRGEMTAHMTRLDERLTIALDVRERIIAIEAKLRN